MNFDGSPSCRILRECGWRFRRDRWTVVTLIYGCYFCFVMNGWWLLKSLRDSFGFSGREHNLKCSFRVKWRFWHVDCSEQRSLHVLHRFSVRYVDAWWAFPPPVFQLIILRTKKQASHSVFVAVAAVSQTAVLTVVHCEHLCGILIHPHSASLQTVCVVHIAVAVEPALCITGIPEDCPD
jgi:hypothetical protein